MESIFSAHDVSVVLSTARNRIKRDYDLIGAGKELKSCHILEAIAASFGFNTYRGMKSAIDDGQWPRRRITLDEYDGPAVFASRLHDLRPEAGDDCMMIAGLYVSATCLLIPLVHTHLIKRLHHQTSAESSFCIAREIIGYADMTDGMWTGRGIVLVNAIVNALFWRAAHHYVPVTMEVLTQALTMDGAAAVLSDCLDPLKAVQFGAVCPHNISDHLRKVLEAERFSSSVWERQLGRSASHLRLLIREPEGSNFERLERIQKIEERSRFPDQFSEMYSAARKRQREMLSGGMGNTEDAVAEARIRPDPQAVEQIIDLAFYDNGGVHSLWAGYAATILTNIMTALIWIRHGMDRDLSKQNVIDAMSAKWIVSAATDPTAYLGMPEDITAPLASYLKSIGYKPNLPFDEQDEGWQTRHGWIMQCLFFGPTARSMSDGKTGYDMAAEEINRACAGNT